MSALFLVCRWPPFCCVPTRWRERSKLAPVSPCKGASPSPQDPKGPVSKEHRTGGQGFRIGILVGGTCTQSCPWSVSVQGLVRFTPTKLRAQVILFGKLGVCAFIYSFVKAGMFLECLLFFNNSVFSESFCMFRQSKLTHQGTYVVEWNWFQNEYSKLVFS